MYGHEDDTDPPSCFQISQNEHHGMVILSFSHILIDSQALTLTKLMLILTLTLLESEYMDMRMMLTLHVPQVELDSLSLLLTVLCYGNHNCNQRQPCQFWKPRS